MTVRQFSVRLAGGPAGAALRIARQRPAAVVFPLASALLACAAATGISIGTIDIEWSVIARVIAMKLLPAGWIDATGISESDQAIVWLIRFPRVAVAGLVGAALAAAGTQMQGMFRNPLAEPSIIGVSQGAALGAVVAFIGGLAARSPLWLPLAAFVGALLALVAVYLIANVSGRTPIATLLLSGIALGALITASTSLLISISFVDWQVTTQIVYWMMGSIDNRSWTHVWMCLPFVTLGTLVAVWHARDLDLLLLGEEAATSLGVDVESVKRIILTNAALLTGAAVAVSGVVGFVGLVVPHAMRLLLGPSHRRLLVASILSGSCFVIICDLLARTVTKPTEIRLGIVTAAFGAPFFLYLLRRRRRKAAFF